MKICFILSWAFPVSTEMIILLHASVKVFRAGVDGPCLHRPENWLLRQLIDDPKPVYEVERKKMIQLEKCSRTRKLVAPCSGEGWGFYGRYKSGLGGKRFSLVMHFTGFLRWTGIVSTFIGGREQSWEHFAYQPCGRSVRLCISSFGWRNAGLHLLRMQEWYCSPWGWDTHSSVLGLQTQQYDFCLYAVLCLLICIYLTIFVPWNGTNLIFLYDIFNVLLNYVFKYFTENFSSTSIKEIVI
jgi:hypothetical protein